MTGPFDDLTPEQRRQIREAHASRKEHEMTERQRRERVRPASPDRPMEVLLPVAETSEASVRDVVASKEAIAEEMLGAPPVVPTQHRLRSARHVAAERAQAVASAVDARVLWIPRLIGGPDAGRPVPVPRLCVSEAEAYAMPAYVDLKWGDPSGPVVRCYVWAELSARERDREIWRAVVAGEAVDPSQPEPVVGHVAALLAGVQDPTLAAELAAVLTPAAPVVVPAPLTREMAVERWGEDPQAWPQWVCTGCSQFHSGWALECGRCGARRPADGPEAGAPGGEG